MTAYYRAFQRLALIVASAYGLMALFFLLTSENLSNYQLLAVYDKIMIYLLTPLLLLLSCRVESVMGPTLAIRLGSRRRVLAACLALHGVCAVFCSLLWLTMTNVCAILRYRAPLLCLENTEALVILRYIPLWLLLVEMSILIGKLLPHKTAALSYAAGYLIFTVELLSVSILLPPQLGLLFSWIYRKAGTSVLWLWCTVLTAVLVHICDKEDMVT